MRSSQTLGTQLWRKLVETLPTGVIVFNTNGAVIYANEAAAKILGSTRRELLELDNSDFAALCHNNRLDGGSFAQAIKTLTPNQPERTFNVMTSDKRLFATLTPLGLEHGDVITLSLSEDTSWSSELIADTVLSEEMHSPLVFAASYTETLLVRMGNKEAHHFELNDLARIARDGVLRAMNMWRKLNRLHESRTFNPADWPIEAVNLEDAVNHAIAEINEWAAGEPPAYLVDVQTGLPPVAVSSSHLHSALVALLEVVSHSLTQQHTVVISAEHQLHTVHVEMTPVAKAATLRSDLFDAMPCAIAEQVITRHGGRVWLQMESGMPRGFVFTLPAWEEPEAKKAKRGDTYSGVSRDALVSLTRALSPDKDSEG